jgi:sugar diacid utilization regulator
VDAIVVDYARHPSQAVPRHFMTSAAHREATAANPDQAATATLSSLNAVFTLSLILTQAASPRQAIHLLTTAVPSITTCNRVLAWHPSRSGDYYERAPRGISSTLASVTAPGQLDLDESSSWWAFPLAPALADNPVFLVVAGTRPLSGQEKFLLTVLAQQCGTVIAKLELLAAERASTERAASLNADLESVVSTLTKTMETHRQLNEIVANAGEAGIAKTLHQLTRFPVLIQDVHGNTRAAAGDVPSRPHAKDAPGQRQELIRQLQVTHRALYHRRTWLVLANPRPGVLGVIALADPARTATETDLAALEYAATVLSVELSRLQSVEEAELRSRRDFAEELLAGADEATVRASAHALGYDPERPHRVIIATGRARDGLDEQFFQAVVREVRSLDVATLVVGRSSYVVVIAYREADWAKLQAGITSQLRGGMCRLAVGSRYPSAWQVVASYREAQFVASLPPSAVGHLGAPVLLFDSLGVYRMLSSVTDPAGIEAFMKEQLGTLLDYDKRHGSDLLVTLAQYFDSGCKVDQAAAALSVHRNTLKYRLKRVRELLGQDLNDGPTRTNLHLATMVWLTLESLRRTGQA